MCGIFSGVWDWLVKYEAVAVWIEGIALVAIFGLDWMVRTEDKQEQQAQHTETAEQMNIWRKQIHAESVREIWRALRNFEHFVVHSGKVAVGKQFMEDDPGNTSIHRFTVCKPYLDLQEAYYLSRLVSERLFDFMKQRMADADSLQRVPEAGLLQERIAKFHKNWDVYEMAAKLRDLS
jgi:hypothetical protein